MKISLGFSPCPNDTFLFDAMIHGKIDTEGLQFEPVLADVEALNQQAFAGSLQVTKLSYHAYAYVQNQYALLYSGSALGRNCGPLLIAKNTMDESTINEGKIAIPGKYTTANFLLSLAYPKANDKVELLFSAIEQAVLDGAVDAGLIIHENRFTYAQRGLQKIVDLGEYWESTTGFPIPLGGIAVHRALPVDIQQRINRVLRRSVAYAFDHPKSSLAYVRQHAQEMEEEVMYQHINLYVNDFTLDLGEEGEAAVSALYSIAAEKRIIPTVHKELFIKKEKAPSVSRNTN